MAAIAVRNVTDAVHARLREVAAVRGVSVESFVRTVLAEAVLPQEGGLNVKVTGFSDVSAPWPAPSSGAPWAMTPRDEAAGSELPELWGALKGSVHVAQGADLAAPMDEAWQADT